MELTLHLFTTCVCATHSSVVRPQLQVEMMGVTCAWTLFVLLFYCHCYWARTFLTQIMNVTPSSAWSTLVNCQAFSVEPRGVVYSRNSTPAGPFLCLYVCVCVWEKGSVLCTSWLVNLFFIAWTWEIGSVHASTNSNTCGSTADFPCCDSLVCLPGPPC